MDSYGGKSISNAKGYLTGEMLLPFDSIIPNLFRFSCRIFLSITDHKLLDFLSFGWICPLEAPKLRSGIFNRSIHGLVINQPTKGTSLCQTALFEPLGVQLGRLVRSLLVLEDTGKVRQGTYYKAYMKRKAR